MSVRIFIKEITKTLITLFVCPQSNALMPKIRFQIDVFKISVESVRQTKDLKINTKKYQYSGTVPMYFFHILPFIPIDCDFSLQT